jgi:hypothetical protein
VNIKGDKGRTVVVKDQFNLTVTKIWDSFRKANENNGRPG